MPFGLLESSLQPMQKEALQPPERIQKPGLSTKVTLLEMVCSALSRVLWVAVCLTPEPSRNGEPTNPT